jgi:uncharacterized membrane protein
MSFKTINMNTEEHQIIEPSLEDPIVVEGGKVIAIVAYLTYIGLIVAFLMNNDKKNKFASYHLRQALGIGLTGVVLGMINIIPVLGWFIAIIGFVVLFVMWVMGLMSALGGKAKPVFLLGEKYQEWFKDI